MAGPAPTPTTPWLLGQMVWRSAGWALLAGIVLGLPAIGLYGLGLFLPPLALAWGVGNGLALGLLTRAWFVPLPEPRRYRRVAGIASIAALLLLLYLGVVQGAPGPGVAARATFTTAALLAGLWAAVTGWDWRAEGVARPLRVTVIWALVGVPYAYWLWVGLRTRPSAGADFALFLGIWGTLLLAAWWVGQRVAAWYVVVARAAAAEGDEPVSM